MNLQELNKELEQKILDKKEELEKETKDKII